MTYPRTLNFKWSAVPAATSYGVEIDCYGCCVDHGWCGDVGKPWKVVSTLKNPAFTFNFVGSQLGRWRVWANRSDGGEGPKSEWWEFTFGRVIEGKIIPPSPPPVDQTVAVPCESSIPIRQGGPGMYTLKPVYNPDPDYTPAAREARVSGVVILGVSVGKDGLVKKVCLVRSLRPDLDERAVSTVKTWRFEPRKSGFDRPVTVNMEISFNIK